MAAPVVRHDVCKALIQSEQVVFQVQEIRFEWFFVLGGEIDHGVEYRLSLLDCLLEINPGGEGQARMSMFPCGPCRWVVTCCT